MRKIVGLVLCGLVAFGCTDNQRARKWGGKEEIDLHDHEMLLNVTWKGDNMWVLSVDTLTGVGHFREVSSFGILEGEVIFK